MANESKSKLKAKPLGPHVTPLAPIRIQSIPPIYRRKSDWYRDQMDNLIENDTYETHWHLNKQDSKKFIESVFPDSKLFQTNIHKGLLQVPQTHSSMEQVITYCRSGPSKLYGSPGEKKNGEPRRPRWLSASNCPALTPKASFEREQPLADFFNTVLEHVQTAVGPFKNSRKWEAPSTTPLRGADANRKPDLFLPLVHIPGLGLDWRDGACFGEVKNRRTTQTEKSSYVEMAGKVALLLYAQDGRHSAPCIRLLGPLIYLTFFDRGGSLSTSGFDIHKHPELFLRILIGITANPLADLGFDETIVQDRTVVTGEKERRMRLTITVDGTTLDLVLEEILFISDALHGRGTTVWSAIIRRPTKDRRGKSRVTSTPVTDEPKVAVKDSWIDPLRKFTEGRILAKLNEMEVEGVPQLIYEGQVKAPLPFESEDKNMKFNHSTHTLRSHLGNINRDYHLRVHSRLVTTPVGQPALEFSCLAELLVAFLDYIIAHKQAVEKAGILHRDISLLNLLLVLKHHWRSHHKDLFQHLDSNLQEDLLTRISNLPRRGLLADWGYAVPFIPEDGHEKVDEVNSQPSPDAVSPMLPPTSPIDPLEEDSSTDNYVPIAVDSGAGVTYISTSALKPRDEITLSMGKGPYNDNQRPSIDTNPLYRTGTWSWMAAELVMAGAGQPVVHKPHHDLESMFYVLLGICVFYDRPYQPKPDDELAKCFDKYFNTFQPSLLKTIMIQSPLSWKPNIVSCISPYFQPFIPLLDQLREEIILPMRGSTDGAYHSEKPVTHGTLIKVFVNALSELDPSHWEPIPKSADNKGEPDIAGHDVTTSRPSESGSGKTDPGPARVPSSPHLSPLSSSLDSSDDDDDWEPSMNNSPSEGDSDSEGSPEDGDYGEPQHKVSMDPQPNLRLIRPSPLRSTGGLGFRTNYSDSVILTGRRVRDNDMDGGCREAKRPRRSSQIILPRMGQLSDNLSFSVDTTQTNSSRRSTRTRGHRLVATAPPRVPSHKTT